MKKFLTGAVVTLVTLATFVLVVSPASSAQPAQASFAPDNFLILEGEGEKSPVSEEEIYVDKDAFEEKHPSASSQLSSVMEDGRLSNPMKYAIAWGVVTQEEADACTEYPMVYRPCSPVSYTSSEVALARFAQILVPSPVGSSFVGTTLVQLILMALAFGGTYAAFKEGLIH